LISARYYSGLIEKIEKIDDVVLGEYFYFFYLRQDNKIHSEDYKTKLEYLDKNKNKKVFVDDVYLTFNKFFGNRVSFFMLSKNNNSDEYFIIH
jgi:hypothetical protein